MEARVLIARYDLFSGLYAFELEGVEEPDWSHYFDPGESPTGQAYRLLQRALAGHPIVDELQWTSGGGFFGDYRACEAENLHLVLLVGLALYQRGAWLRVRVSPT